MKLLLAFLPLPTPAHEDFPLCEIASVPRSERRPAFARQSDLPADPWAVAQQERLNFQALLY